MGKTRQFLCAVLIAVTAIVAGVVLLTHLAKPTTTQEVSSFEDCAKAGYPILQSFPRQCKTPDGRTFAEQTESPTGSIILKIPIIEYKTPSNTYPEATIKGYNKKLVKIGEEFVIDPVNLIDPSSIPNRTAERDVGDIKLKLVDAESNSIIIEILANEGLDGKFHPREPSKREEIADGGCINASPLVTDVAYKYCFSISKSASQLVLEPKLESKSTMPTP